MREPHNGEFWLREKDLQDRIQKLCIEREIYWSHRDHQNWMLLVDKNTKCFQTMVPIGYQGK